MPVYLVRYNTASQVIDGIKLITRSAVDFKANPTLASGDVKITKDGGAYANLGTLPTVTPAAGTSVHIALAQAETACKSGTIDFIDQTATKEWEDQSITFWTYGHADAMFASWYDAVTVAGYATNQSPADALTSYDPPTRAEATTDTNSVLTAIENKPVTPVTDLSGVLTAIDDVPTNAEATANTDSVLAAIAAKPVTPPTDLTAITLAIEDIPNNAEATANKGEIITAILEKPVTPPTDLTGVTGALDAIKGTDFDTTTDSLKVMSDALSTVASAGDTLVTYTVTEVNGVTAIPGVLVVVCSAQDGSGEIARGYTNSIGQVKFWLTSGATVYPFRQKAGYAFTNPDKEIVP